MLFLHLLRLYPPLLRSSIPHPPCPVPHTRRGHCQKRFAETTVSPPDAVAGLYLHVPFREAPCRYDDTAVVPAPPSYDAFAQAVTTELRHYADRYDAPIRTIYVGGGRPSLLDLETLRWLFDAIRAGFETPLEEVTVELNPADADAAYLEGLRALGVDRLSLDVMSFHPDDLTALETPHTVREAEAALDAVRAAGFARFSIDLFFGWAGQDPLHWKANLEKAARLGVPHLALVECTADVLPQADDDTRAEQYRFAMTYLPGQGYEHYEVAHFARPGRRGLHNERHWNHTNYLGVGPSAHSFWWDDLPAYRWANVRNLARYTALLQQRHLPIAQKTPLTLPDLAAEYVLLRLRTRDGLDLATLQSRYGVDLVAQKGDALARLRDKQYIEPIRNGCLRLTDRGLLVCDAVTQQLLPD